MIFIEHKGRVCTVRKTNRYWPVFTTTEKNAAKVVADRLADGEFVPHIFVYS